MMETDTATAAGRDVDVAEVEAAVAAMTEAVVNAVSNADKELEPGNDSQPVSQDTTLATPEPVSNTDSNMADSAAANQTETATVSAKDANQPETAVTASSKDAKQPEAAVAASTKDANSVVITQNGSKDRDASPIVIDDESDDDAAAAAEKLKAVAQSNQTPRKTRLECSFNDGSFCCVTCDYKTPSNISFASHVVIHLHRAGENGLRLCNICKCDKIIDVVKNCPLVRNMMKLLVEQKNKWKQEQEKKEAAAAAENDKLVSLLASQTSVNGVHPATDNASPDTSKSITDPAPDTPDVTSHSTQSASSSPAASLSEPCNIPLPLSTPATSKINSTETSQEQKATTKANSEGSNDETPASNDEKKEVPLLDNMQKKIPVKRTAVKVIFENGRYNCKTCNYSVENENTFRKHLWKDLHKKLECNHCPEHIKYDKFSHCTLLNQFMKLLEKSKGLDAIRNSPARSLPDADAGTPSPAAKNSTDRAANESQRKHVADGNKESQSHSPMPDNADISHTLAMLDGLNQAQGQHSEATSDTVSAAVKAPSLHTADETQAISHDEAEAMDVDEGADPMLLDRIDDNGAVNAQEPTPSDTNSNSRGYVCPVPECNDWTTQSQAQFKTHIKTNHADMGPLQCVYCFQIFSSDDELISHIDSEHMTFDKNKYLFRCSFDSCVFSSNVVIDFRVHNIIKHKNECDFKCCHCAEVFATIESLISHIQSNILNLAQCTICRCTSTNKNIITKHIKSVHPGEPRKINMEVYVCCKPEVFTAHTSETTSDGDTIPPIILRRKETTYLCPCDFVAKDIYAFKEHINMCSMHRRKSSYIVPPLVTSVPVPPKLAVLDQSEIDTTSTTMEIDINSIGDDTVDDTEMDMGTELDSETPPPAPKPSVYEQLKAGEETICDHCNFATHFKAFLNSHREVHNRSKDTNKCFTCQHCPFSTNEQKVFVHHLNCHSGRKVLRLFQCKYCSLTCNQNDFIEDHLMDAHPNEDIRFECAPKKLDSVPCTKCDETYSNEKELLDHMKDTHGEIAVKNYAEMVYGVSVECNEIPVPVLSMVMGKASKSVIQLGVLKPVTTHKEPELNISEGYLSCAYCSYTTHEVDLWKQHQCQHIGVGSQQLVMYCCRMCDWPSSDTRHVIDHCMKEHFMSAEQAREGGYETNYMEISGKMDAQPGRGSSNNKKSAWELPAGMSIEKYHCDVCEFSTNDMANLSKHKLENHGTIEDDEDEAVNPVNITPSASTPSDSMNNTTSDRFPSQVGSKDRYICKVCPYTTDKAKHWHSHRITHEKQMTIQEGLKCGYCMTMATKLNTMRYHHNRYHYDKVEKFHKVTHGVVMDELVVGPEDMENPYPSNKPANRQLESSPVLLKELLTTKRRFPMIHSQLQNSFNMVPVDDEDSDDSADGDVIEEEEVESNEEYQEESHIITKAKTSEDPSKYCTKLPGQERHQCIRCTFTHKYPSKVLRHFRYRHEKFCPYRCGYCNFTSVESPKIRRHIHIVHKNMPVKILDTESDSTYDVETTEEFRAERAATLGVQEDLEYIVHKFIVKGQGNVQGCLLCGYKQEGASSLKRHLFAVHLQYHPYKCKYCDLTAVERNKVIKHLEKSHPDQEMRIVRLKFKGPLPEVPDHMANGSFSMTDDGDSQNEFETLDDEGSCGLGLKITSVSSRGNVSSQWNNFDSSDMFSKGNITSAHITMSPDGQPIVTVKDEPNFDDNSYGMMPANVSIRDDEDDEETTPLQLGRGIVVKTEMSKGLVIPRPSNITPKKMPPLKSKSPAGGEIVHKMCMYCNYTTRWNIGDVKTHILVTHLKRYPYGCKFCSYTGRDKKKLKNHCKSQHPTASNGTGFRYLYNEYSNILVVKKIGKDMYIGVKGLDSIEAVEKASRMTMEELRELAGPEEEEEESPSPPPPPVTLQTPVYQRTNPSDAAEAMIRKHQEQLQRQMKGMAGVNSDEPLDLSVSSHNSSTSSTRLDLHKSFLNDQMRQSLPSNLLSPSQALEATDIEFTNKHLQCRKCGYVHFDMYKLKVHILGRHLKQKPYACSECGFDDFTSHKVARHVSESHENAVVVKNIVQRDPEIKKYVGHVDTSKKLVRPYMRIDSELAPPKPFGCGYCNYQARSRAKVKYHSIRKHKGVEVKMIERNNIARVQNSNPPSSTYTPMSSASIGLSEQLTPPVMSPTASTSIASADTAPTMLNPGVTVEQNQNFTCSKCYQPFQTEEDLEDHESRAHSVISVYQCVYCPSRQRHQYKLKQHQRLKHPNEPVKMVLIQVDEAQHRKKSGPIIPLRPPKPFGLANIINPSKTINGVYQCSYCPSRISYKAKMNWHQRVKHAGLTPKYEYIPNELSDKARAMAARRAKIVVPDWRAKLQRYVPKPLQDDMYKCKACNFSTRDQFCMRNHAQAHTGYRPYRCPYCVYGNVKSFPVKMHVRKHHPTMPVKHKVERDPDREAELREIYSSPVRKIKVRDDSARPPPPPPKKRMIEFDTSGLLPPASNIPVFPKNEPMSDDEESNSNSVSTETTPVKVRPYCCALCGHGSSDQTGIKRHIMWEIKYLPYHCPQCNYRDVHPSGIETHGRRVHKVLPIEAIEQRDPVQEEYLKNLVEESRRKKPPNETIVFGSTARKSTAGRMSMNTLKAIKKAGNKATSLFKCKDCGFITSKYKHIQNHIVRHGPKRHQCGYCDFQAYYPYEISQHCSKAHVTLPLMSNQLELELKPTREYYDVVKMTAAEAEKLVNGEAPSFTETPEPVRTTPQPSTSFLKPANLSMMTTPVTKPGPKSFKLRKQALGAPIIDGLRIPEHEFQLNERGNYKCRYCDYENDALQHFKNHLMKHVPPRWKCFYCKCLNQLSYDLRKHIKKYHPGHEMKIIKLDPHLHPPESFAPPRTGIAYTIDLSTWEELIHGLTAPGRKDTDTIIVPEHEDQDMGSSNMPVFPGVSAAFSIKQERMEMDDDCMDDDDDGMESDEMDSMMGSSLCLNCCYCTFSTRDTSEYAAHLRTHTSRGAAAMPEVESQEEESEDEEDLALMMIRMQTKPPSVRVVNIMELDPISLEFLLRRNGVTGINF